MDNKQEKTEFIEKMIAVNRVTKVIKGGRVLRFSAIMVVGDGDGRIGMGTGKAREVVQAVQKATDEARRNMMLFNLAEGTIYHAVKGRHGASYILMQPAPKGTGIIAGGPVRMFFEAVGIKDIQAKNIGSTNPYNILRAAINGLSNVSSPADVAVRRSLPLEEIQKRHRLLG